MLHRGLQLHPENKAPTAGEPARPSRILFPCQGSGSAPSTSYLQGVGHRAPLDGLAVSRAVNHDEPHSCCHCCDQHGLNHLEAGPVDVPAKGEHHTGFSSSPIALRNTQQLGACSIGAFLGPQVTREKHSRGRAEAGCWGSKPRLRAGGTWHLCAQLPAVTSHITRWV